MKLAYEQWRNEDRRDRDSRPASDASRKGPVFDAPWVRGLDRRLVASVDPDTGKERVVQPRGRAASPCVEYGGTVVDGSVERIREYAVTARRVVEVPAPDYRPILPGERVYETLKGDIALPATVTHVFDPDRTITRDGATADREIRRWIEAETVPRIVGDVAGIFDTTGDPVVLDAQGKRIPQRREITYDRPAYAVPTAEVTRKGYRRADGTHVAATTYTRKGYTVKAATVTASMAVNVPRYAPEKRVPHAPPGGRIDVAVVACAIHKYQDAHGDVVPCHTGPDEDPPGKTHKPIKARNKGRKRNRY